MTIYKWLLKSCFLGIWPWRPYSPARSAHTTCICAADYTTLGPASSPGALSHSTIFYAWILNFKPPTINTQFKWAKQRALWEYQILYITLLINACSWKKVCFTPCLPTLPSAQHLWIPISEPLKQLTRSSTWSLLTQCLSSASQL